MATRRVRGAAPPPYLRRVWGGARDGGLSRLSPHLFFIIFSLHGVGSGRGIPSLPCPAPRPAMGLGLTPRQPIGAVQGRNFCHPYLALPNKVVKQDWYGRRSPLTHSSSLDHYKSLTLWLNILETSTSIYLFLDCLKRLKLHNPSETWSFIVQYSKLIDLMWTWLFSLHLPNLLEAGGGNSKFLTAVTLGNQCCCWIGA